MLYITFMKCIKLKEETHQKIKVYVAENKLKSFGDAMDKLLEAQQ